MAHPGQKQLWRSSWRSPDLSAFGGRLMGPAGDSGDVQYLCVGRKAFRFCLWEVSEHASKGTVGFVPCVRLAW